MYRGVRTSAMGGAATALADDADAVFYNPAGIALNSGIQVRLMNPKFDVSTDTLDLRNSVRKVSTSGYSADTLKAFFGENLYLGGSVYPSLLIPNFTLGYYGDFSSHFIANNLAYPQVNIEYYYTRGFVGGFGFELRGIRKSDLLRLGTTVKFLTRRGVRGSLPLVSLAGGNSNVLKGFLSSEALGFGIDLGAQYELRLGTRTSLISGVTWHDIGDTNFGSRNVYPRPPSIPQNLAVGMAFVQRLLKRPGYDAKLAFDLRHITQDHIDWRRKIHFGSELKLGPVGVQLGLGQLRWSAGATLDVWLLEFAAASYAVENTGIWGLNPERRYIFQITMKLDASGGGPSRQEDREPRKRPRLYNR